MKKNFFSISASKNEKGVSMLLAVLILSILLAIALGISHFITEQTKMMREIGYSVKSFYAADSGIEKVLLTNSLSPGSVNGSTYTITCGCCDPTVNPDICPSPDCLAGCDVDPNCRAPNYCLKSIGDYQGFRRAIQVDY
jgi:hypothetical protein